ncbi:MULTISPECIES: portal protein [spotted fever group]|nr:portal protein [Rickettsia philipii]
MPIKAASAKWPDFADFKERLAKNPDETVKILHIVSPQSENQRGKGGKGKGLMTTLAYSSEYIYLSEQKIISQSGYSYFPFFVTLWIKGEGQVYGYAPAHHAISRV